MIESNSYEIERFNLSYNSKQNEMRRIIIVFREKKGLSVEDLAKKLNISREKLNKMELGEERIELLDFAKIIEICGVL